MSASIGDEREATSGVRFCGGGCEEEPPANELATREETLPVCGVVTFGRPLGEMPSGTSSLATVCACAAFHAAVASSESHRSGSPTFSGTPAPSSSATGSICRMRQNLVFWIVLIAHSLIFASWWTTSSSFMIIGT